MKQAKKILGMLLAGGMLCSMLFGATGCSDSGSGNGKKAPKESTKYVEVFDAVKDCDVESVGASMRILQTDYFVKNWLKESTEIVSTSDLEDLEADLSTYVSHLNDEEKADFGVKCQAVIDADVKIGSSFVDSDRLAAWGVEPQEYSESDVKISNQFISALQNGIMNEQIKPEIQFPYIEASDDAKTFDKATLLDLMYSISNTEVGTAGSSYSMDLDTADFMQFVIDNKPDKKKNKITADEVKAGAAECYQKLSPSNKLTFDWFFPDIIDNVNTLLDDPVMITDMGKSVAVNKFAQKDLDTLVKAISEASGVTY